MDNVEDARRCIKYLDRSILDGRVITVALVSVFTSSLEYARGFLSANESFIT